MELQCFNKLPPNASQRSSEKIFPASVGDIGSDQGLQSSDQSPNFDLQKIQSKSFRGGSVANCSDEDEDDIDDDACDDIEEYNQKNLPCEQSDT